MTLGGLRQESVQVSIHACKQVYMHANSTCKHFSIPCKDEGHLRLLSLILPPPHTHGDPFSRNGLSGGSSITECPISRWKSMVIPKDPSNFLHATITRYFEACQTYRVVKLKKSVYNSDLCTARKLFIYFCYTHFTKSRFLICHQY